MILPPIEPPVLQECQAEPVKEKTGFFIHFDGRGFPFIHIPAEGETEEGKKEEETIEEKEEEIEETKEEQETESDGTEPEEKEEEDEEHATELEGTETDGDEKEPGLEQETDPEPEPEVEVEVEAEPEPEVEVEVEAEPEPEPEIEAEPEPEPEVEVEAPKPVVSPVLQFYRPVQPAAPVKEELILPVAGAVTEKKPEPLKKIDQVEAVRSPLTGTTYTWSEKEGLKITKIETPALIQEGNRVYVEDAGFAPQVFVEGKPVETKEENGRIYVEPGKARNVTVKTAAGHTIHHTVNSQKGGFDLANVALFVLTPFLLLTKKRRAL